MVQRTNVIDLLKKELNLSEDAVQNGFELVKTKSCIKVKLNGKTIINLKASDQIEYTVFQGLDFEYDIDDEDNYDIEDQYPENIKNYVVVQNGFAIYF